MYSLLAFRISYFQKRFLIFSRTDTGYPTKTIKIGICRNINSKNPPFQSLIITKQAMVMRECIISIIPPTFKVGGNNKSNPPIPKNKDNNCIPTWDIFALLYTKAVSGFITPSTE